MKDEVNRMGLKIADNLYLSEPLYADDQLIIAEECNTTLFICWGLYEKNPEWRLCRNFNKTEYLSN